MDQQLGRRNVYQVKFYQGNYKDRQRQANDDECVAYVEHHFNAFESASAKYTVVITGSNASQTSKNWGRWYAHAIGREFGVPVGGDDGIKVGGYGGRGDYNMRYTHMPAILLEPLFASNPQHAQWIKSKSGQQRLAQVLVESIQRIFPGGGLIGLSVGHKYKTSRPNDRGAPVYGGGTEADHAEKVLKLAATALKKLKDEDVGRELRVIKDGKELWKVEVDEDAVVRWDEVRGALVIREID